MTKEPSVTESDAETVLVVDDDDLLRTAARRVLGSLGYRVLEAESGRAAETLVEQGQHFDLLISDINMPEMNGFQLSARLQARLPNIRTLFMCGYPVETIENVPVDAIIVEKPFTRADLAENLRRIKGVG